jgi:type I restriction enzyme S subunit
MKQGWEVKKLGDLCQIELGKTPYRGDKSFWDSENETNNVWLSIADLLNTDGDVVSSSKEYITDKATKICKIVKAGTLLLSFKLTLGRLAFAGKDLYTNEAIAALTIKQNEVVDKYFLYQFLSLFDWNAATEGDVKVKGKTLNKAKLKEIEVHFPTTLKEQQRIVAILDEAFAAIAQAKSNAEQNLKNAKELFESYLQSVFENKGEGWEEKEFGSVITTLTDYHANGSYEVLKENVELKDTEDYAWMVRSTDFENNFKNSFRYIDKNSYEFLKKSKVFGGEIIMSKIGNAGNVYLMPKSNRPCSLAMNLFLIRIDEKVAIPEFIYQYLKSKKGEIQIKSRLLGMATKTITKDNVRNIVIPFPSLKEQQIIVQKLDALSAETKQLETIYQQKINDLDELKKSILQKAFAGELNTTALEV